MEIMTVLPSNSLTKKQRISLRLWKEAQDTILHDVEEEDYWEKFDPWLQEKAPDLYEKIMKAFHEEFWERMGCYSSNRDDYDFVSVLVI